jgi:hypothetical protein
MLSRRLLLLLILSGLFAPALWAAGAPSDEELINRFHAQRKEFNQLVDYLNRTNTRVMGVAFGEYSALKQSLGIKRFYVTDRGPAAYRFPVYLRPPLIQYLRGYTKGYAWLPMTSNFPHYPGAIYMVDPEEPPTSWAFAPGNLDQYKIPRNGYTVVLRHIEGPWYIYADNNPYRHSW